MIIRAFRVWGREGHRQRESFLKSRFYPIDVNDFDKRCTRQVHCVLNSDETNTNDYSILVVAGKDEQACFDELNGQLTDGVFENSNTGKVEQAYESSWIELQINPNSGLYEKLAR